MSQCAQEVKDYFRSISDLFFRIAVFRPFVDEMKCNLLKACGAIWSLDFTCILLIVIALLN